MPHVVVNSVQFKTHFKHGAKNLLAHDRARAENLLRNLQRHQGALNYEACNGGPKHVDNLEVASHSVDVTDAGVTYTMPVGIGHPPTNYTLLIDTGSSNTWIGAQQKYTPTNASKNTQCQVNVTYGSGSFTGTEYEDQVTLGKFVIKGQSIGVASEAQGFNDVDGILGIGPVDLTIETVKHTGKVPTVTDNLFAQKLISTELIGISYNPTTGNGELNGEITFGEIDPSKFKGDINYIPVTGKTPASKYWGINQTISYEGCGTILSSCAGIVDTGTTLLLLATDAFQAYQKGTGAVLDHATGLLTVTEDQFSKMQSLLFHIGSVTYEFTPNAQIWPRSLNKMLGGEEGKIYLITADLGNTSGSGLDFINGFAFLQRFYTVYDTTNYRIGFANTPYTHATSN